MARAIARETYKMFMKKYSLQLMIKDNYKYKYKSMKEMASEIYDHETFDEDIQRGLKEGLYYFTQSKSRTPV